MNSIALGPRVLHATSVTLQSLYKTVGSRPRDIGAKSLEAQWAEYDLCLFLF